MASHAFEQLPPDTRIEGGVPVATLTARPEELPPELTWSPGRDDLDSFVSAVVAVVPNEEPFALVAYDRDPRDTLVVIGRISDEIAARLARLLAALQLNEDDVMDVVPSSVARHDPGAPPAHSRADDLGDLVSEYVLAALASHLPDDVAALVDEMTFDDDLLADFVRSVHEFLDDCEVEASAAGNARRLQLALDEQRPYARDVVASMSFGGGAFDELADGLAVAMARTADEGVFLPDAIDLDLLSTPPDALVRVLVGPLGSLLGEGAPSGSSAADDSRRARAIRAARIVVFVTAAVSSGAVTGVAAAESVKALAENPFGGLAGAVGLGVVARQAAERGWRWANAPVPSSPTLTPAENDMDDKDDHEEPSLDESS